jgi:hypothetical protein
VVEMHGADWLPEVRHAEAKSGVSAMFAAGLSGGRIGCDATGITGGVVGWGVVGWGAGGWVVGGATAGATVGGGAVVVTGGGAVVAGVTA